MGSEMCIRDRYIGSTIGTMISTINPFSTIIASNSAGINWTTGLNGRFIMLAFGLIICIIYIVRYAQRVKKDPTKSIIYDQKEEIENILTQLDLLHIKNQKPNTLSTGQLQRLGIALGVIHKPNVIFADEPTSSLDDKNCKLVIDLLKNQAKKSNANLIIITHDQRIKSSFTNTIVL